MAAFPLLFGIQQWLEGMVWLTLESGGDVRPYALGFLFFAFFLWPFWVPLATWQLESVARRRAWLAWITLLGLLFGALLYLPLVLDGSRMQAMIVQHSIAYPARMITDELVPRPVCCALYVMLTSLPLLFSSMRALRPLGILVLISTLVSLYFFRYAFVSVWCLFAALLSLYLLHFFRHCSDPGRATNGRCSPPNQG